MLKSEYLTNFIRSLKLDLKLLNVNNLQSAVETSFSNSNDEKNVLKLLAISFYCEHISS
jgi:hypothetical protein